MNDDDPHQRAIATALRFITHRPRSAAEVRTRLLRSYPSDVADQVLMDLVERKLVDDRTFAKLWKNSRDSLHPRSARAIRRELISKGVSRDLAEQAVADVDEADSAYRAGIKHARRLEQTDFHTFRRRLWGFLQRRGFGPALTRQTVARLWKERQSSSKETS